MKLYKLFAYLFGLAVFGQLYAVPYGYEIVTKTENGSIWGNFSLARVSDSGFVKVWQFSQFPEPIAGGYRSAETLKEIDCADMRHRRLQVTLWGSPDGDGAGHRFSDKLLKEKEAGKWEYALPGSGYWDFIREACSRVGKDLQ